MKVYMEPIEVIAWFDREGKSIPLRFQMSENHERVTVNLKNSKLLKEEKLAGNRMLIFRCETEIGYTEKIIELKYEISTCKWYLFKM